jgi:DNA-directed RNA polymerase subunit RPC12/RpoP
LRLTRKELLSRKPGYATRILRTLARDQEGEVVSTIENEVRVPVMRTKYRNHYLCANPRCQKESYIDTVEVHEQDTETTVRHVSLDFSSLQEAMGKGGIQMTTYKCPQCGGALALPDSGKLLKCKHCGTVVKPVDVFEKIKDLL